MNEPLAADRHPQGDLFLFDVAGAPIKDLVDMLEHPFYSLSKRPEMSPRLYRHGPVQVELIPSRKGLPTIYDKDLLIYAVSKVAAGMRRGLSVGPVVEMPSAEILQFTNRGTSGREYRALEDALERLAGTLVKTTIRAPKGGRDVAMFHLVENATLGRRGRLGVTGCTIRLPAWVLDAIEANAILTLHPDYFRLKRPLEKRLYELGRKHCGNQPRWTVGIDTLHRKAGAQGAVRNFRGAVKRLTETDHLPDYCVALDPASDLVTFRPRPRSRAPGAVARPLPHLSGHALDAARQAIPGADVYALESEWRAWAADKPEPGDAELAFLGFVRSRAGRTGT